MNQEALQKVLIEMDNQLNKSRAELSMVNVQLDRVHTNLTVIESTKSRLNKLCEPTETVWQGVGKAFVADTTKSYLEDLQKDSKQFKETESSLNIKKNYLTTTLNNTIENMQTIVGKK
ncbi:uncharacterized protein J8A68_006034 [[Candida] subhashii]|uniref:Prefoldin subunit 1 n=1 Tax=[Candida] subhashii TaxID=561895 RepID=A0A8J5UDL6_9ASCO|nr:uncharacterized protein J8A68_006034 [[Candida] subhashii]KAG7660453.1 hypothetical protein J8A68_006034 [[Candida] subhashii]